MYKNDVLCSFYIDESEDGNEKVKWRSLPVHHLKICYHKLQLNTVLDDELDVRNTPIEELSV